MRRGRSRFGHRSIVLIAAGASLLGLSGGVAAGYHGGTFIICGSTNCFGSNGQDDLADRNGYFSTSIDALGGTDVVWSLEGDDYVQGRPGNDLLLGYGGYDDMFGNEGNDYWSCSGSQCGLEGNGGRDLLEGRTGIDVLRGNDDNDILHGDEDGDYLHAFDSPSSQDTVSGGGGTDKCWWDSDDIVSNCEIRG